MDKENGLHKEIRGVRREILFTDIAVLILGALMVLFPGGSANIICRAVGVILCVWGVIRLIFYFAGRNTEVFGSFALVQGAALLGFGVYFLARPQQLAAFLTVALGIILIIGGVMKLQYAIDFYRLQAGGWWVQLIGAALMAVLGVVALLDPFGAARSLTVFTGVALLVNGLWDLAAVGVLSHLVKKLRRAVEELGEESRMDDQC